MRENELRCEVLLPRRAHPGGFDGMVKNFHGIIDLIDKAASCLGQPDAACLSVEEDDAKVLLQCPDPQTDT